MAENRSALIVAISEYQDAGLRQLVAPAQDAEALAQVLGDPAIGSFAVQTLLNQPSHQINREIEAFFANRVKDDLLLLYFSGHGLKDEEGRLYFATTDTDRKFLRTTAVAATLINDVMHTCRSRRQVLILDCCYSGAFARGMTHRADETVGTGEHFREGRGQFVLTASDALQYAFEGDDVSGTGVRSVFTHTLVRGLETGEADLDGDGAISCDELYDYLHGCVTDRMPQQRPRKWAFAVEGDIMIARNPRPVVKLAALPAELRESIENPLPWVREGAARHLRDLLQQNNKGLAATARAALQQMVEDDSLKVRTVVAEILETRVQEEPLVMEEKKKSESASSNPYSLCGHQSIDPFKKTEPESVRAPSSLKSSFLIKRLNIYYIMVFWPLANTVSGALGGKFVPQYQDQVIAVIAFVVITVVGAGVGSVIRQLLFLRQQVLYVSWLILFSVGAMVVGVGLVAGEVADNFAPGGAEALYATVFGAAVGSITGFALVWLLQHRIR